MRNKIILPRWPVIVAALVAFSGAASRSAEPVILNASFDIARELFQQYNPAFIQHWKEKTGETVKVTQSHAGSSKQSRAVIDGLAADVATINQATDIDAIAEKSGSVPKDWRSRLPHHSAPFASAIVFLVRKGNPKAIKDWGDLVKPGVSVIVPNPKKIGQRTLQLPVRLRFRPAKEWWQHQRRPRIRARFVQECARARHRRARSHDDFHGTRHR